MQVSGGGTDLRYIHTYLHVHHESVPASTLVLTSMEGEALEYQVYIHHVMRITCILP
jgi:hypothetical protein